MEQGQFQNQLKVAASNFNCVHKKTNRLIGLTVKFLVPNSRDIDVYLISQIN